MNINTLILKSVQLKEIQNLKSFINANFMTFKEHLNKFQIKFVDYDFDVFTKDDTQKLFNAEFNFLKFDSVDFSELDLNQTVLNINCLYLLLLVCQMNSQVTELTDNQNYIFTKLKNFFNWDENIFPPISKVLNKTYAQYFAGINFFTLVIFIFWQMNTNFIQAANSKFPLYCLAFLGLCFIIWIYSYLQIKKIPDTYKGLCCTKI